MMGNPKQWIIRKAAGGAIGSIAGFVAVWSLRLALPYVLGAVTGLGLSIGC